MSKNIIIQEGGEGRQFTADKLKTALVGGGSCLWIPEDEAKLGTKSITEDGTYEADDDGLYGYSSVTVRGIGKVTGKDPVTGEETQITTEKDPQTGEDVIKTKVIPSSIRIVTPPTQLTYNDGDLIDFSGMVVKAYLKSGAVFTDETYPDGIIPDAELDKPVKVASLDGSGGATIQDISDMQSWGLINASFLEIVTSGKVNIVRGKMRSGTFEKAYKRMVVEKNTDYAFVMNFASDGFTEKNDASKHTWIAVLSHYPPTSGWVENYPSGYVIAKTQLFSGRNGQYSVVFNSGELTEVYLLIDWAAITDGVEVSLTYSDMELIGGTGGTLQSIPVNWLSPYDGKTMTDSFTITVNPAPEPEPEEGGETP